MKVTALTHKTLTGVGTEVDVQIHFDFRLLFSIILGSNQKIY